MSNHLAIATVTASLQRLIQAAIQTSVEGARATTVRPNQIATGGTPEVGVNIFLYQTISNAHLANLDAAPLRSKGTPPHRQTPLDLYYMFSFYGNEAELQPQRLLGSVVSILSDKSILNSGIIQDTCNDPTFEFLRNSDLHQQVPDITITPVNLSLEDLSKTWSVFYQTPYVLSVAYKVMIVVIEGEQGYKRALPVRDRGGVGALPFPAYPRIDRVIVPSGSSDPIFADSILAIQGRNLQGAHTEIKIGDLRLTPASVSSGEIVVELASVPADSLGAGVQSLQVVHRQTTGAGANLGQGVESNAYPLILRPKILRCRVTDLNPSEDHTRSAVIIVQVDLTIHPKQRVVLALNEFTDREPEVYLFYRDPLDTDSRNLRIPVHGVKPGEYLLRLIVDGAETILEVDNDPHSPTYQWYNNPKVRIR
jgi:hypothetical protein